MRLWRGRGGDDDGPDAGLDFLSRGQAGLVRKLFREAMAERGRELAVDRDGRIKDARGSIYSLRNIAALCRGHPGGEKEWPQLIAGYADQVLKADPLEAMAEIAALTPGQARSLVYPSVFAATSLGPGIAGYRSAPELAPGLLELLALDMPDSTVFLDDAQVDRLGGRASLREAGLANLRALPAPARRRVGTPDAHFEAIGDESHFTASRVLVMPDLLSRVLGANAPHGVLAAMPARNWAFIHVLADRTAGPSLMKMASNAHAFYGREEGPISPDVFWWRASLSAQFPQA
jgi:hypothetical protein